MKVEISLQAAEPVDWRYRLLNHVLVWEDRRNSLGSLAGGSTAPVASAPRARRRGCTGLTSRRGSGGVALSRASGCRKPKLSPAPFRRDEAAHTGVTGPRNPGSSWHADVVWRRLQANGPDTDSGFAWSTSALPWAEGPGRFWAGQRRPFTMVKGMNRVRIRPLPSGRCPGLFQHSPGHRVGGARLAPAGRRAESPAAAAIAELLRSAVLDNLAPSLATVDRRPRHRETGDRHRLAPSRVPSLLAWRSRPAGGRPEITAPAGPVDRNEESLATREPVFPSRISPRWFSDQWLTDSLVTHNQFHFLQCRARGAKSFPSTDLVACC